MGRVKNYFHLFRVVSIIIILHQFLKGSVFGNTTREVTSKVGRTISGRLSIGVVLEKDDVDQIEKPFTTVHTQHSNHYFPSNLIYSVYVDVTNTADIFKLSRVVCTQFGRGSIALLAAVPPNSFETFHSYANTFHVPLVAPYFPKKEPSKAESGTIDYAISILPDYHKAIQDTVHFFGWKNVIYLYDSQDGMERLQQLFETLIPGTKPYFRIANIKKVKSAKDVIGYLKHLERSDRWSNKYVILDCATTLAKDSLVSHVRDPTLGRRNYHYLLTGLVLDDAWEPFVEYSTINVTGFKLVDTSRTIVKDFSIWSNNSRITAKGALMYDAAHTLFEALDRIYKQKPYILRDLMNNTNRRFISCTKNNTALSTNGNEIIKSLREIELEGLTGNIRFVNGVRKNFSLMVFQNSHNSQLMKIGTWYDDKGFIPEKNIKRTPGKYDRNRVFTILSIQEAPYFTTSRKMEPKGTEKPGDIEYGGFCADLALLIAEKLGINVQFRLAADGKFGGENPNVIGGWDGMIGELLRKEADMIIAPMVITPERQTVIDFSKPFLSFHQNNGKSATDQSYLLELLKPFASATWILIGTSIFLVSIVMHIVFRCTKWNFAKAANPASGDDISRTTVINEFSFSNSVWYVVSLIMQQGTHVTPRTFSGRIVSTVWRFFTLVMVCSYIAIMASQLTVNRLGPQIAITYNRIGQCPEDMNVKEQEITITEEKGYEHMDDTFIPRPGDFKKSDLKKINCEMLVSVVEPGIKDFAIGFAKGSTLRADVDIALTSIRNDGGLKRILREHFQKISRDTEITGVSFELTLENVAGLFYILVLGLGLALVVSLFEYCMEQRSHAAKSLVAVKTGVDTKSDSRLQVQEILETCDNTLRRRRSDQDSWDGGRNTPGSYTGADVQAVAASEYSSIITYPATPIFIGPVPKLQDFEKRLPQTPLRAVTELPVPQTTPRKRSQLNLPCSSPGSSTIDEAICLEVRQGMSRQRSHPVMDDADETYFTRKSTGPEEAAHRNSYTQI